MTLKRVITEPEHTKTDRGSQLGFGWKTVKDALKQTIFYLIKFGGQKKTEATTRYSGNLSIPSTAATYIGKKYLRMNLNG